MATGLSLVLRWLQPPPTRWVHRHPPAKVMRSSSGEVIGYRRPANMTPYRGPSRDRSLPGKARIRARRAAVR